MEQTLAFLIMSLQLAMINRDMQPHLLLKS